MLRYDESFDESLWCWCCKLEIVVNRHVRKRCKDHATCSNWYLH